MAALELDHLAVPLESFPAIIPKPTAKQSLRQNPVFSFTLPSAESDGGVSGRPATRIDELTGS
jgi:hypothetical protein